MVDFSEELDVSPGDGSGEGPVAGGAEAEMEISDEDFGDVVESSVLPPSGSRDSQVERYEEISGVHENEEYGPVRHWRDRVRDRQTERVDTSAQHVRNETRLGKHFRKRKTKYPDPKDVFFSELGFLHDLENHQFQGDHFEKTGCTASFQSKFCKCCERVHEVMTVETDETKRDPVVEKGTVWQKGDGCCVAVHQESRYLLLVPSELEGCPVSTGSLKGERLTEVTYEDGTMEILEDDCGDVWVPVSFVNPGKVGPFFPWLAITVKIRAKSTSGLGWIRGINLFFVRPWIKNGNPFLILELSRFWIWKSRARFQKIEFCRRGLF